MRTQLQLSGCLILLLLAAADCRIAENTGELSQTPCQVFQSGRQLRCFKTTDEDSRIVEPLMSLTLPNTLDVKRSPVDQEYYFEVPLNIKRSAELPNTRDLHLLQISGFEVQLAQCQSACQCQSAICRKLSVLGVWPQEIPDIRPRGTPVVRIGCRNAADFCDVIFSGLKANSQYRQELLPLLQFRFVGQANGKHYTLTKRNLPVTNFFREDVFLFENKILLFAVTANSGHQAAATFLNSELKHPIPADGRIPTLFRSGLIDRMSQLFEITGRRRIVAEMRDNGRMVAQVVFDISVRTEQLNKESWFEKDRVISSHPYPIGAGNSFNYFNIRGDIRGDDFRRSFLIGFEYGGCPGDKIFWVVTDAGGDPCTWANRGWGGQSPAPVYTVSYGLADATARHNANQFLVYLE